MPGTGGANNNAAILAAVETNGAAAHVIGERVTRVETKIEGLEKDTAVIRSTLHSINSELQKNVANEINCARSLAQIAEQTKCVPDLVAKIGGFEDLKPKLQRVIDESNARRSVWKVALLVGSGIVGATTVIGVLASLLASLPFFHH